MRTVIRFITRKSRGEVGIRETRVNDEHLIAGRGNDCGLHLPDPRVLLRHAEFALRSGVLYVTALNGGGLQVSGNLCESSRLVVGQKVRLGPYEIIVEEPAADSDLTLSVELVQPLGNDLQQLVARSRIDMTRIGLTQRGWSWIAAGAVVLIALITPLALNHFMPAAPGGRALNPLIGRPAAAPTRIWTSGPVSAPHKFFGDNCNTCHVSAFSSVPDSACLECHRGIQSHADAVRFPRTAFADSRCQDCHKEHHASTSIAQNEQRFCNGCHAALGQQALDTKLRNVSDFALDHPEFRPTIVVDPSTGRVDRSRALTDTPAPQQHIGLKFPHDKHLQTAGVRDGSGAMVNLACRSCHSPDENGVSMRPANFERDCHGCHQLKFDANVPDRELLHVAVADVYKQVRDVYDAVALRGGYQEPEAPAIVRRRPGSLLTAEEKKAIGDWAAAKTKDVMEGRFGKGLCGECHELVPTDRAAGDQASVPQTWTVTPVILNATAFPMSHFSHAKHVSTACRSCHDVTKSVSVSEVLMPSITVCRSCHGSENSTDRVPSTCTECHAFHHQDRAQMPGEMPAGIEATQHKAALEP